MIEELWEFRADRDIVFENDAVWTGIRGDCPDCGEVTQRATDLSYR
jgi:hypothetical protein